jgi:hypothetical protein
MLIMSQVKRYEIRGTFEELSFIFCKLVAKGFLLNEKYLLYDFFKVFLKG